MSRDWEDDGGYDEWSEFNAGRWEHNSKAAIQGKKGQKFLREIEQILINLPMKRLANNALAVPFWNDMSGEVEYSVCIIGAYARAKGIPEHKLWDWSEDGREGTLDVAQNVGLTRTLASVCGEANDLGTYGNWVYGRETEQQRYTRVLVWVRSQIKVTA